MSEEVKATKLAAREPPAPAPAASAPVQTAGQARAATTTTQHGAIQAAEEGSPLPVVAPPKNPTGIENEDAKDDPIFPYHKFQEALTTVQSASDKDAAKSGLKIARKLIVNATTKGQQSGDDAEKFRRVRLANSKIKAAIVDVPGNRSLMLSVGFELHPDNANPDESLLVFPPGCQGPTWLTRGLEQITEQIDETMSSDSDEVEAKPITRQAYNTEGRYRHNIFYSTDSLWAARSHKVTVFYDELVEKCEKSNQNWKEIKDFLDKRKQDQEEEEKIQDFETFFADLFSIQKIDNENPGAASMISILVKATNDFIALPDQIKYITFMAFLKLVKVSIREIQLIHENVGMSLECIRTRGNEDGVTPQGGKSVVTTNSRIEENKVPQGSLHKRIEPKISIELESQLMADVNDNEKESLGLFQDFVGNLLQHAPEYKPESDMEDAIGATVAAILNFDPGTAYGRSFFSNLVRPSSSKDSETVIDQPILRAIILRIMYFLKCDRNALTSEQFVPSSEKLVGHKGRYIDLIAHEPHEFVSYLLPSMLDEPIEIKAVSSDEKKFRGRIQKACNQISGHLGKKAWFHFNFGGVGENCKVYGIALTIWSVTVLKLELQNIGTEKVKTVFEKSRTFPLSTSGHPESVQKVFELDPQNFGFDLLAGALRVIYKPPGRLTLEETLKEKPYIEFQFQKLNVERLLGSGAFSNVVEYKQVGQHASGDGNQGYFMKIPKAAAMEPLIEWEAKTLNSLHGVDGIPQLTERISKDPKKYLFIGCEETKLLDLIVQHLSPQSLVLLDSQDSLDKAQKHLQAIEMSSTAVDYVCRDTTKLVEYLRECSGNQSAADGTGSYQEAIFDVIIDRRFASKRICPKIEDAVNALRVSNVPYYLIMNDSAIMEAFHKTMEKMSDEDKELLNFVAEDSVDKLRGFSTIFFHRRLHDSFIGFRQSVVFKGLQLKGIVGRSLYEFVHNAGCTVESLAGIIDKVCLILIEVHEKLIVHLDVTPGNIIVGLSGAVMLSDFGCASRLDDQIEFRGCLPYAHDDWLSQHKVKSSPRTDFDFANLFYTWVHMRCCCKKNHETQKEVPWGYYFQYLSDVDDDSRDKRREFCLSTMKDSMEDRIRPKCLLKLFVSSKTSASPTSSATFISEAMGEAHLKQLIEDRGHEEGLFQRLTNKADFVGYLLNELGLSEGSRKRKRNR